MEDYRFIAPKHIGLLHRTGFLVGVTKRFFAQIGRDSAWCASIHGVFVRLLIDFQFYRHFSVAEGAKNEKLVR